VCNTANGCSVLIHHISAESFLDVSIGVDSYLFFSPTTLVVQVEQLAQCVYIRDGTGSPLHRSPVLAGYVGSRVSVSDPVFDPVSSFNMRVYRGVVSAE